MKLKEAEKTQQVMFFESKQAHFSENFKIPTNY